MYVYIYRYIYTHYDIYIYIYIYVYILYRERDVFKHVIIHSQGVTAAGAPLTVLGGRGPSSEVVPST